ncbi:glycoside-pentoside-hexuronide (GPH):cation symporter [Glaciecola sp. KUL10]|uniref:glycoside-pentoside-hexuronide (GPH):cation symporter n=1 Tax=Glaciecola sp. (strain KUL10) TaxID=2161813 RepID=UPI000D884B0A|nr:glycoside-pentoside-hexuronide (GPH):cation symporter [Glaciecola sp. KUL10]GBL04289.1 sugar (Glycoside-Pentoside-Hexuronide) transporter [Glaciecola sp. KUL10]
MESTNNQSMEKPVKVTEKFAYGLGDTASNIVFQVVIGFLMFYYTDVFGLSAAAVGTLFLVVRIFDAITDPIMGGIADRTQTKWGKYRPYLLWMCIPYGLIAVLAFSSPDFSAQGKLIFAYVTYTLLMTVYTAINIPYSALGGVMTSSSTQRASIQSWRFALAMIGGAIVTASMLPLVEFWGQGNKERGYLFAMATLSIFAVICFVVCFVFTKERTIVEPNKDESQRVDKQSILADVKKMLANDQWRIIALITFVLLISVAMRGSVTQYYVTYYLGREDMVAMFMTAGMLAGVAGALSTDWLSRYLCKVSLMRLATTGIIVSNATLFFVPQDMLWAAFALMLIANFTHMVITPLLFSAVADTVDYGAVKHGSRAMAMSFSGHLWALKIGIAIGGAMTGWILAGFGYEANVTQSDSSLLGIKLIFSAASALAGVVVFLLLRHYRLTNKEMATINSQ